MRKTTNVRKLLAQLKRELLAFSKDTVGVDGDRPAKGSCHEVLFDMVEEIESAVTP